MDIYDGVTSKETPSSSLACLFLFSRQYLWVLLFFLSSNACKLPFRIIFSYFADNRFILARECCCSLLHFLATLTLFLYHLIAFSDSNVVGSNSYLNCQHHLQEISHEYLNLRAPLLLVGWFPLAPSADFSGNKVLYKCSLSRTLYFLSR